MLADRLALKEMVSLQGRSVLFPNTRLLCKEPPLRSISRTDGGEDMMH